MKVSHTGRPRVMGILNVTPDSFSDAGEHVTVEAAVAHADRMIREGAEILDVGGESTRPGSQRVDAREQIRRVVEPIRRVRAMLDDQPRGEREREVVISIDTTRVEVAAAALDAGASMINDISAGRDEPGGAMFTLAAERRVPLILMHMLGEPATMQQAPRYDDVVGEVNAFLLERAAAAEAAGVPKTQIILDPGIGFGKTLEHNLKLLAALPTLVATGYPVLLGASRKRFLSQVPPGSPPASDSGSEPVDRLGGTVATTVLAVAAGAAMIRVHDVAPNRQAVDVAAAVCAARESLSINS